MCQKFIEMCVLCLRIGEMAQVLYPNCARNELGHYIGQMIRVKMKGNKGKRIGMRVAI